MHHLKLESLLEATVKNTLPDCRNMDAEGIINLIDRRAPEGEFELADIFSDKEISDLRLNRNIGDIKAISEPIYDAIMSLISDENEDKDSGEGGEGEDEDDGDSDDSLDDEAETLDAIESFSDLEREEQRRNEFFFTYKRPSDVSSKITKDAAYDIEALIKRRISVVPDDVLFGMDDLFSEKELMAISRHPSFDSLPRSYRGFIMFALDEALESAALEIEEALIHAFLGDKVLRRSLAAESAYRAGFADSDLRLNELGENHARDLILNRLDQSDFVFEAADPSGLTNDNDEDMDAAIKRIAKSKALISIRPNLNRRGEITIHKGRLGRKQASVKAVSIKCTDAVVRPSGQSLAQKKGDKTVHAGFVGTVLPEVIMPDASSTPVTYNPHKGDKEFKVNGKTYSGGGVITMVGYKAFKVK